MRRLTRSSFADGRSALEAELRAIAAFKKAALMLLAGQCSLWAVLMF